ncbi:MAG: hypothetical protein IME99_04240 [Proteobacteria bacterium]|nr:hypothetical protein [Pseudomonadota bacterium]
MQRIKEICFDRIRLVWGGVLHFILIWSSLALGYNSYKDILQESASLTVAVKDSIKGTFPWGILIFVILYVLCGVLGRKAGNILLTVRQYGIIVAVYVLLMNILFFSRGISVLVALNLSAMYIAILLIIIGVVNRFFVADTAVCSDNDAAPTASSNWHRRKAKIAEYFKESDLSSKFIIAFTVLLVVCALLLLVHGEKHVEVLAGVAYLLLVLGVAVGVYRLIRYGDREEKE